MRGPRVRASDVTGLPCALQWRNPARVGLCRPEWSLLARLSAGILFWRAFVRFLIGLENNLAVARAEPGALAIIASRSFKDVARVADGSHRIPGRGA